MRRFLLFLISFLLFSGSLFSQAHLFLEEQELTLADGKVMAWVFPATASQEETLDDLKEYLKGRSDVKLKKDGDDMLIAEKVSLPAITVKRGDLIGLCRITEQYYSMAVIVKLGYDVSLSTSEWPEEMENLRHYTKAYMAFHYEQVYARRIKDIEKLVKDSEKVLDQAEGKVRSFSNKISSNHKKIAKETDEAKIGVLEAENNTLEGDQKRVADTLPAMVAELDAFRTAIEENKTELNTYLATIATF